MGHFGFFKQRHLNNLYQEIEPLLVPIRISGAGERERKIVMSKKKRAQKTVEDKREAKKALVMGNQRKNPLVKISVIALAILVIGGGVFLYFQKEGNTSSSTGITVSNASSSVVSHPVSLFEDGKARHFSLAAGDGITVNYFVLKSSDGVIRAAFDACDVCWPAGKGYYQSGDVMICRNCGRRNATHEQVGARSPWRAGRE